MDDITTVEICPVRKRSVEIPLENLLSKVIYLSGELCVCTYKGKEYYEL